MDRTLARLQEVLNVLAREGTGNHAHIYWAHALTCESCNPEFKAARDTIREMQRATKVDTAVTYRGRIHA